MVELCNDHDAVPGTPRLELLRDILSWNIDALGVDIMSYDVQYEGGHCNSGGQYSTTNMSATELELGLEKGSNYTLWVRAVNAFTSGDWSQPHLLQTNATSKIRDLKDQLLLFVQYSFLTAPSGAPENVSAEHTSTTISLSWDEVNCFERNGMISRYRISYAAAENVSDVNYIDSTGFQENLTGLLPSTTYVVSIAAVNDEQGTGPAQNLTITTMPFTTDILVTTTMATGSHQVQCRR